MKKRQSVVCGFALLLAGGAFGSLAAQRDTPARPITVAAATAAGVKLLGVFDANTGEWLGHAVVRDTLGRETLTSDGGIAALSILEPVLGQYMLEIRKEGYAPQHFKLRADTAAEFLVALMPNPLGSATALPAVVTTEQRTILDRDEGTREGFFQRCSTSQVACVGPKELEARPTDPIGMLLKQTEGVTVTCPLGWTCHTVMQSKLPNGNGDRYCDPTFYVNGRIWVNGQLALDNFLSAPSITGIEVYLAGRPTPPRFSTPGTKCGAVVIWTR